MNTNETPASVPAAGLSVPHGSADSPRIARLVRVLGRRETEIAQLRGLLQQMLVAAENCDETGYADGVGFVDLEKLHTEVRSALSPNQ
jgi:hypothetical protein